MALLADQSGDVNSNLVTGTGTESVTYTVPGNVPVKVESVVATITNGAAAAVTPAVTIRDQSGVVIADKAQRVTIPAGDSGRATFALRLDDDLVTVAPTQTLAALLLSLAPAAFWKLNETSGTTGFDSSGNNYDIDSGAGTPPTWGQAAGPPGEVTADFTGAHSLVRAAFPIFGDVANDMTALGWLYYTDSDPGDIYTLVGQGTGVAGGFGVGWEVGVVASLGLNPKHLLLYVGDGAHAGTEVIYSDNALTENTWYAWAVVHDAGTWTMYVEGVAQASTSTRQNAGATGVFVGGNQANIASFHLDGRESYVAIFPTALTAAEVAAVVAAAGP